ncbi:MAG: AAA family ATPase [Lachnospiraceae bacterium]|nr:AAA family ATPase [Lachnospiraceae bacterium]
MNRIESITIGDKEYTHKADEKEVEEAAKRDETLEKDKERLAHFDKEFVKRFGTYTNPVTGENIKGAQDYFEAVEATEGKEVPDRGKLTSTELDKLFADRYTGTIRKIKGIEDYLKEFDEEQKLQQVRVAELYSKIKARRADKKEKEDRERENHDKSYYIEQLNNLIGLESIKKDVKELISLVEMQKYRRKHGMKDLPVSRHLVFMGNPGTGKTTVARILAKLYRSIGVLEKGQLVETDRGDLVAGYVGQTALKTKEKIEEAMGGILFIDEAYTLNKEGNDFGQEAIDTILKAMEDNRDKFIVIVAGYPKLMEEFINSNPGLKSRFSKYFNFPDYTEDELYAVFNNFCKEYDYSVDPDADMFIRSRIIELERKKGENFANARDVRNMFEKIISNQATRVMNTAGLTRKEMMTIIEEDL